MVQRLFASFHKFQTGTGVGKGGNKIPMESFFLDIKLVIRFFPHHIKMHAVAPYLALYKGIINYKGGYCVCALWSLWNALL
jgi:hypothetical protein